MVYHILRDGRRVNDVKGYVVKMKDNEVLYNVIRKIESRGVQDINREKIGGLK